MYQLLKLIGTGSGGLIHLSEVIKMSIDSGNFFPPSDLATWVYVDVIYKYRSESFLFKICVQFRNIFSRELSKWFYFFASADAQLLGKVLITDQNFDNLFIALGIKNFDQ